MNARLHFSSFVAALGAVAALVAICAGNARAADSAASIVPEIGLSLRGVGAGIVEQGEPLRVAVRIEAPPEASRPLVLEPATGTWAEAVAVELTNAGSGAVVARGEGVGRSSSPRATLDARRAAGGLWRFTAATTALLEPGDYRVQARLAIPSGAGWTGAIASDAIALRVVAPSREPARVEQRVLALAQDALLTGAPEEAARLVDAELVKHPGSIPLLTLRARVAVSAGNLLAARLCVNRALSLQPSDLQHPSLELNELSARITASLESAPSTAAPPAWSWPPIKVFTAPGNSAQPLMNPIASAPAASAPAPVPSAAPVVAKREVPAIGAVDGAVVPAGDLADATILATSAGQWAVSAVAGSQYGKTQYSAVQATGAPNISVAGNSPDAWCPASKTNGTDWLEVTFAKPVHAAEVRVRQNDAAGAITKIEAIDSDGTAHVWWDGLDPYKAPAVREIVWFAVRVPKTAYLVTKVRITLNLAAGPGWKEIDAVQLVGAAQ